MIVRYDTLKRLETPSLILCNPGSKYDNKTGVLSNVIGTLVDCESEETVLNFNATSELNFRVNKIEREDAEENAYTSLLYKSIQNRRLVFLTDIGYFMITSVKDGSSDGIQYKDVTAQSADIEIQQKMIPYVENGTYKFYTEELETADAEDSDSTQKEGLFNKIVSALPLWTIGDIDAAVTKRYRTFEDVDTSLNCLSFMMDNMQDAYECIFVFDIIHRVINVYDQANYVRETSIHLTKDDLINSIDITENADDLYTAISVLGDDENVTISAINPLGTNTIYNFTYYIDWMSAGLGEKVKAWQKAVSNIESEYYTLNENYYTKLKALSDIEFNIQALNTQIALYIKCRNNIVAEGSTDKLQEYNGVIKEVGGKEITDPGIGDISKDIEVLKQTINDLIAECDGKIGTEKEKQNSVQSEVDELWNEIIEKRSAVAIENYFNEQEREELNLYIYEGSFKDEYVTITDSMSYTEKFAQMKTLYDRAKTQLKKISEPTQEFSIDVENFLFVQEFEHMSEQLETGCLINVELGENDVAPLFLSNITVNFDDCSMSMTFGNRFNKFDPKSLFENVLGNVSKSANTLDFVKDVIKPISNGEFDNMKSALQTSRDLTMRAALSSGDEEVVIDSSGYTGKSKNADGSDNAMQVKIIGKNIVFTDDGWETCKLAIGRIVLSDESKSEIYGINAKALIGDIIMGRNLTIKDSDHNDILSVMDKKIKTYVEDVVTGNEDGMQSDGKPSIIKQISSIQQTADSVDIIIKQISKEGADGNYVANVTEVETTTGYKLDAEGLNIKKSGEEMQNLLTNRGMYVNRDDESILAADNEGVNAINLRARKYLIIGANSRFEDYSNGTDEHRTACYYIGTQGGE